MRDEFMLVARTVIDSDHHPYHATTSSHYAFARRSTRANMQGCPDVAEREAAQPDAGGEPGGAGGAGGAEQSAQGEADHACSSGSGMQRHVTACHGMSRHVTACNECNSRSRHVTACHGMSRRVTACNECNGRSRQVTACSVLEWIRRADCVRPTDPIKTQCDRPSSCDAHERPIARQ